MKTIAQFFTIIFLLVLAYPSYGQEDACPSYHQYIKEGDKA
jgi:hypothetical protein